MSSDHNILRRFFANTNRLGEGNLLPNLRTVTFCGRRTQLMESYLSIDARTYRTFHPGAMAYNRATLREHMRRSKRSTSIQPPIHAVRQPGASVLTRRRGRSIPPSIFVKQLHGQHVCDVRRPAYAASGRLAGTRRRTCCALPLCFLPRGSSLTTRVKRIAGDLYERSLLITAWWGLVHIPIGKPGKAPRPEELAWHVCCMCGSNRGDGNEYNRPKPLHGASLLLLVTLRPLSCSRSLP